MEQDFNENKKIEITNEVQLTQTAEETSKDNVKVDGTNVSEAAKIYGKNMYKFNQNDDKPGRIYLEPKNGRKR